MDNNTQLPAEVVKRQQQLENDPGVSIAYIEGFKEAKNLVATEYATKLQEANKEKLNLQMTIKGVEDQLTVEIVKCNTARTLLSKFISRHEAGLLPDRFIYDEIKQFLDGTK